MKKIAKIKMNLPKIETLVENLQKKTKNESSAKCPACGGVDRFCVFTESQRYWCRQCDIKGDILDFHAMYNGITTQEFIRSYRPNNPQNEPKNKPTSKTTSNQKPKITATYDYLDADGALLFQVCRFEPGKNGKKKSFSQRRPDGKGGWEWNLKEVDPVLYRLPEILNAGEVLVTEGEKDADALVERGFTATTNPMGAGNWRSSYNQALKEKDVVLLPDNDEPGQRHADKIAQSLNGTAKSIKIINLPDLPEGGDVSDWLARFNDPDHAAEELAKIIDGANPYTPKVEPSVKTVLADMILSSRQVVNLDVKEKRAYFPPWLNERTIGLLVGPRGVGKSWFAQSTLHAVASGSALGPWKCENPVKCLYLDGEMPIQDQMERISDLNLVHENYFVLSDHWASMNGLPKIDITRESCRQNITEILKSLDIKLWAADNLSSLTPGTEENTKMDWDPINQWLIALRFAGIATLMVHHTGKDGAQRGTSGREDNIDYSISLKKPKDYIQTDGARFIVSFTKSRVRTKDLNLIADLEFKLIQNESGEHVWTSSNVQKENKLEVIKLLDEEYSQKDVCELLGLSKGYVSKIVSWAKDEGLLSGKCKLTPSGFDYINKA